MPFTKTKIIRVDNSQGVRIPRNLLRQAGLVPDEQAAIVGQEVELEVGGDGILVRRTHQARAGWEAQFQQMTEQGDEVLLDGAPQASHWDEREWVW